MESEEEEGVVVESSLELLRLVSEMEETERINKEEAREGEGEEDERAEEDEEDDDEDESDAADADEVRAGRIILNCSVVNCTSHLRWRVRLAKNSCCMSFDTLAATLITADELVTFDDVDEDEDDDVVVPIGMVFVPTPFVFRHTRAIRKSISGTMIVSTRPMRARIR